MALLSLRALASALALTSLAACGGKDAGTGGATSSGTATTSTGVTGATTSSATTSTTTSTTTSSASSSTSSTASSSSSGGAGGASSSSSAGGAGGTGGAGGFGGAGGGGGALPTGTRVRIAAANLTSGLVQSYDPGNGKRILQGIHADVILLQEFNVGTNSASDLMTFTTDVCGLDCNYVRGAAGQQIPNGIITRYPILASGSWADSLVQNRDFVWAHLDVPGPVDLWAISVHLLTSNPIDRGTEGSALAALIAANIPAADYVTLGGDFNTKVRDEAALMNLDPIFAVQAPYPVDQLANEFTNGPRTKPYDWVLSDDELSTRRIPVVIGQSTFGHGAVIDTRVYTPLTDIAPALLDDSGSTNMQHMAVVRDFALE